MDTKELRELIELISRSDFSSFELEKDDFKLKLKREDRKKGALQVVSTPLAPPRDTGPVTAVAAAAPVVAAPPQEAPEAPVIDESLVDMQSPIVGTFYTAPGPDSPTFVKVGDRVRKGQTMCIIEAMKLMNEIEAETDGEVVEICINNAQPVEYGEILFRLRP